MKFFYRTLAGALMLIPSLSGLAQGWPSNYEGVMLQGFYWDSYADTKWTNLESQAPELSQYFDLIWVPNSGWCDNGQNMGYMPVYWFTNHNSSFGTEAELRSMIKTYKNLGTGIIEDVVINHRNGYMSWYDFPAEEYNGVVYDLTDGSIVSNDNVWSSSSANCPVSYKGNPDTGDLFDGCRDLDHTNPTVQEHIKAYTSFLLNDLGYSGFRYDMVKGYAPQYTKIYNEYSKPEFSVGEYWDSSYDAVQWWIDGNGKTSAAFDFPCKYQINKAFNNGLNLTELTWSNPSGAWQPAGMIHYGYPQYAVTFVDNHDTYRDDSKMKNETYVLAANAFILTSPGTPCVFLPHYKAYKSAIQAMIKARKGAGIHNLSKVNVITRTSTCYMAEVTGTKGKLAVKIGSDWVTPAGYTDADIAASGESYCIWVKADGFIPENPAEELPESNLYLQGNFNNYTSDWDPTQGLVMEKEVGHYTLRNVKMNGASGEAFFSFSDRVGDWDYVNAGTRYGADGDGTLVTALTSSTAISPNYNMYAGNHDAWKIANGNYDFVVDATSWTLTVYKAGMAPVFGVDTEEPGDDNNGDNSGNNNGGDDNTGDDNNPGNYPDDDDEYEDDFSTGIDGIDAEYVLPYYINMQGGRVDRPTKGIFIKVTGKNREKVVIR